MHLETLFARYSIADDLEKKTYTTSFLKCDLADQWEALEEFLDTTQTYADFKSSLVDVYNLNLPRHTLSDLQRLVSDQFRSGFRSLQDLTAYHLRFNAISSHLLNFGLLSSREQSHLYLQAFDTLIQPRIDLRLQIKYSDHHSLHPHSINTLFDAARWILGDPTSQLPPQLARYEERDATGTTLGWEWAVVPIPQEGKKSTILLLYSNYSRLQNLGRGRFFWPTSAIFDGLTRVVCWRTFHFVTQSNRCILL